MKTSYSLYENKFDFFLSFVIKIAYISTDMINAYTISIYAFN